MMESVINVSIPILPLLYDIIINELNDDLLFQNSDINNPRTNQIQRIHAYNFVTYINISIFIFSFQILILDIGEIKYFISFILLFIILILSNISISLAKSINFSNKKVRLRMKAGAMIIMFAFGVFLELMNNIPETVLFFYSGQ